MTRLIVLTKYFGLNYTGATTATQQLVACWQRNVDEIDIMTLHVGACLDFDESIVAIEKLPNAFALSRRLKELGEADGYYSDDHLGVILRDLHPFVHTYHGNWPIARWQSPKAFIQSLYFMPCYERIFRTCDMVVNVSRKSEAYTNKFTRNSEVIHNGIMSLPASVERACLCGRILMAGSVCRRKYEHLASVARRIYELRPNVVIHVYGSIVEEDFAARLSALPNVELKGYYPKPPFWDYDILMCTSASENLPISICEALACGTPVVSFDVGGIGEAVTEGRGYLVEPYDSEGLAYKAVEALGRDDWKVDSESVRREFSWESASKRYLELFSRLSGAAQ